MFRINDRVNDVSILNLMYIFIRKFKLILLSRFFYYFIVGESMAKNIVVTGGNIGIGL